MTLAWLFRNGYTTLTTLNLASNNIGKDGAVAIAAALRNDIDDAGSRQQHHWQ
jgi:hypothetical protein